MFPTDGMKAVFVAVKLNSKSQKAESGCEFEGSVLPCESLGLMNTVSSVVGRL